MMAYLPLILLFAAALSSGVAVLLFTIYLRSSREKRNTIFPVVRETEALRATWARLGFILFAIVSAISAGGWFATQQRLALPSFDAPDAGVVTTVPDDRDITLANILTATPTIQAIGTPTLEPVSFNANTPTPTSIPPTPSATNTTTSTPTPTQTSTPTETQTPIPSTFTPTPTVTATVIAVTVVADSTPVTRPSLTTTIAITSTTLITDTNTITDTDTSASPITETIVITSTPGSALLATTTPITPSQNDTIPSATPTATTTPIPLPDNTKLGPVVFATEITSRRFAVNPQTTFPLGVGQIYAIFPYEGMRNGWDFTIIWYYQDREILNDTEAWRWGSTDQSFTFIRPTAAGSYRVELQVNGQTMTSES
ncbi:MAG: hypothetical protein AAF629_30320, partial [Chloroflexota bacterium]